MAFTSTSTTTSNNNNDDGRPIDVLHVRHGTEENSVLHIAARLGYGDQLVQDILNRWPELMMKENSDGDLPIHAALKSGNSNGTAVATLIRWLEESNMTVVEVLGWKNNMPRGRGNTPLHIALEKDLKDTAKKLVDLFPQSAYTMNHEGVCPLYLAIKKEFADLVNHMLHQLESFQEGTIASLSQGKSVLHAAVFLHTAGMLSSEQKEILEAVLRYGDGKLIELRDEQGWTALSYAACNRALETVRIILEEIPNSVLVSNKDKDTSFPIHVAVHGGDTEIINSLACTWSLVDAKCRNILHMAALAGSSHMVRHLLSTHFPIPEDKKRSLINQKDEEGNTPLHLATLAKCFEVVDVLIQDPRVDITLTNNKQGLTAQDLAKNLVADAKVEDKGVRRLNWMLERATKGLRNYQLMDVDLYKNLVKENVEKISERSGVGFQDLISLDGNNILHFVACMDTPDPFVTLLDDNTRIFLMEQPNINGDLPIHLAARAGKSQNLHTLFEELDMPEDGIRRVCERHNKDGNTALHEAVLNNHFKTARDLCEKHKNAAYCLNKYNICPLFLAIKNQLATPSSLRNIPFVQPLITIYMWPIYFFLSYFGSFGPFLLYGITFLIFIYLMKRRNQRVDIPGFICSMIIQMEGNENIQNRLKDAKSVVHGAILARRKDILKCIIDRAPRLVESFDGRGRSPLSYAAYIGYVEGVSLLLSHDTILEFRRDNDMDGSFPIHYAAKGGHSSVMKLFTLSEILVNDNKQNALHVAAAAGRAAVVAYLLKQPKFKGLINTGDGNGNTPLHLAVEGFHSSVVDKLTSKGHIDGNSTNKELLTPQDLIQRHPKMCLDIEDDWYNAKETEAMQRMLRRVKGKNSILREKGKDDQRDDVKKKTRESNSSEVEEKATDSFSQLLSRVPSWQKANILLVVAVLLITLSYTTVVAPPGDYDKNGKPVLLSTDKYEYKIFYYSFCAFICSVLAAVILLAVVVMERKSPVLLSYGATFLFFGLIFVTVNAFICVSSSAGSRAIQQTTDSKRRQSSIWTTVPALVLLTDPMFLLTVLAFPFFVQSSATRIMLMYKYRISAGPQEVDI